MTLPKLIVENPFAEVRSTAVGQRDRLRFVTQAETAALFAACHNHHWRAIIALARYGGLRCPSEVLSVRWQDVNWETGRVVITSPKTEHLGKASRVIPLFPELREHLEASFELAPIGSTYVVDERMRTACCTETGWRNLNLRTTFTKIIRRAGLNPWPRLFHNLRASRETELVERYLVQVVTDWLGNTPKVALRHYLMTTDTHFESASMQAPSALHNPVQQLQVLPRTIPHADTQAIEKAAITTVDGKFPIYLVAGTGLEPVTAGL